MTLAQSRRERHRQELRDLILDAAREALLSGGYEHLSMRRLAETVGISPGTIYLHFQDKQALVDWVVDESFEHLLEEVQKIDSSEPGIPSLKKKLRGYVDFGLRYPHHYHLAFMLHASEEARSRRSMPHAAFDEMRAAVRDCVEMEQFRSVDVETTSQALWAAVHGITSLLIARPGFPWTDPDRVIDQVIETAVEGLRRESR